MTQGTKSFYWKALKEVGVTFDRHYREYTLQELAKLYEDFWKTQAETAGNISREEYEALANEIEPEAPHVPQRTAPPHRAGQVPTPVRDRDPEEMAGQRLNSQPEDEPIRIDENGLIWYQEEVRKPSYPKPRGRRVLKYMDTGTKTVQVKSGDYVESFEVAGDRQVPSEVKITLPSFQVGIYKDPRFPFKIHVYNEVRGFNRIEVEKYYGGRERVPEEVKRIYVENVLCYDIRATIRAIETEYRRLQLQGKA